VVGRRSPLESFGRTSLMRPRALGDDGVAVDGLEVLLAGEDEAAVAKLG